MREYVCENCEERFDEPDFIEEPAEYDNGVCGSWNTPVCPCCGSDMIFKSNLFDDEEEEGEEEE